MTTDPTLCARCGQPHRRCKAHNRRGGPCDNHKSPGQEICHMHGSKAPQAKAAAERRLSEAEAQQLVRRLLHDVAAPPVDDPLGELRAVVGRIGGAVDALGSQVNELGEIGYTDAAQVRRLHVVVEAWKELTIEYRKSLTDMVRLGIEERVAALDERKAAIIFAAIERVFTALSLSAEQRTIAGQVLQRELLGERNAE